MAGIRLSEVSDAIAYNPVPWSRKFPTIKTASFPKGAIPPHLREYLFKKGGIPAKCAAETADLAGAARVTAMNACVSREKGH